MIKRRVRAEELGGGEWKGAGQVQRVSSDRTLLGDTGLQGSR